MSLKSSFSTHESETESDFGLGVESESKLDFSCFVQKPERLEGDLGQNSRPNFGLLTRCKIRRAVSELNV